MRRMLLLMAIAVMFMALAASSAFAEEVPAGSGCEGIIEAAIQQKTAPPQDQFNPILFDLGVEHGCLPGR